MKSKRKTALWVKTFPKQAKALRPENSRSGGIKYRSQPESVRMAIYSAINQLYACAHPYCEACQFIPNLNRRGVHFRDDTHHKKGKEGLLLFDVREFVSVCRLAHNWIGDHPEEATKLGLLTPRSL